MRTEQVGAWLAEARSHLINSRSHTDQPDGADQDAGLDAQILLASVLEKPRAWLMAHPEAAIDPQQKDRLASLLDQLAAGVPLPYLIGRQAFYGLDFIVSPAVLIPRPDTELLVERAIAWLNNRPGEHRAADVGTGSGSIAISIARKFANLHFLSVDRSWEALQVARQNALRHSVSHQVTFCQSDLLSAAAGPFDLVCANLPYIPQAALANLIVARHEPRLALDGGPDGLSVIEALLADAPRWLAPGGLLLLEMQYDQGEAIRRLAQQHIPHLNITIRTDLAGLPRLVELGDPLSS